MDAKGGCARILSDLLKCKPLDKENDDTLPGLGLLMNLTRRVSATMSGILSLSWTKKYVCCRLLR